MPSRDDPAPKETPAIYAFVRKRPSGKRSRATEELAADRFLVCQISEIVRQYVSVCQADEERTVDRLRS